MPADPLGWPEFDAPLLRGIAAAFVRRRRAIRHRGSLECEREFEETPEGTFERLNIDFDAGEQLRLSVWADGAMWLRACAPRYGRNRGWAFKHHFDGTVGAVPAEEVVRLFEESILVCAFPEDDCGLRLRALWAVVDPQGGV